VKRSVALALAAFAIAALAPASPPASAREPGPPYSVTVSNLRSGLRCPKTFPTRGRSPVLLVHGTTVTADESWGWNYVKALPAAGFDVCTVQMPNLALDDIQISSEYVVYALRTMFRASGRKVSVVGSSQGAIEPRWAIRWWPDIRTMIDDYVSMAGTNHGSYFGNMSCAQECLPALWQQYIRTEGYRAAPRLLTALNAGDETPGSISYSSIYSLTDPVVQPIAPYPTAAVRGASNVAVQDVCPGRVVEHVQSLWDATYYALVLDALTHRGPADPERIDASVCNEIAMPGVDPADAISRTALLYAVISRRQQEYPKTAEEPPLEPYVVVGASAGRTVFGEGTTTSGMRRYMLHIPPGARKGRPLVVYLHGCSERNDASAVVSGWNELANDHGFYVLYPDQPTDANGNKCWNWYLPDNQHRGAGEPAIIAAITRSVMRRYAIDAQRVYVSGISAGGAMSNVMAATYPELWAAVGSEAGIQYRGAPCLTVPCLVPPEVSARWAVEEMGSRARQIPFFALVGDADAVSPAENTERSVRTWLAIDDLVDNGADDRTIERSPHTTTEGAVRNGYAYTIDRYVSRGCVIAERWLVKLMGHVHSGGRPDQNYTDPKGPDAAAATWRFFVSHPKRDARVLTC
jgi:poly(hydroxyalkanoate) depolymerase family esterase